MEVDEMKQEESRWTVHFLRAAVQRWQGEYKEAITNIEQALKVVPKNDLEIIVLLNTFAGTIHREAGLPERGLDFIRDALLIEPYHPYTHLEMAQAYEDLDQRSKAVEHITIALDVWKDADAESRLAVEAKKLQADWGVELLGTP